MGPIAGPATQHHNDRFLLFPQLCLPLFENAIDCLIEGSSLNRCLPTGDHDYCQEFRALQHAVQGQLNLAKVSFFLIRASAGKAQNLVPNGGLLIRCPFLQGQLPCDQLRVKLPYTQGVASAELLGEGAFEQIREC